jgi:hypothetical protein
MPPALGVDLDHCLPGEWKALNDVDDEVHHTKLATIRRFAAPPGPEGDGPGWPRERGGEEQVLGFPKSISDLTTRE